MLVGFAFHMRSSNFMNKEEYLKRKAQRMEDKKPRGLCLDCFHPPLTCYCSKINRFDPKITFVILIHWREAQKRISTGRLSHLCLQDSLLLPGYDYSNHPKVNALLEDPKYYPVILYPGKNSVDLSKPTNEKEIFPKNKKLLVFVIDGTWFTARKTMHRSKNLKKLPQICFTPNAPSRFRIRKQPKEICYSTVEAIHQTIDLIGNQLGYDISSKAHDNLIEVFDHMVDQQIMLSEVMKKNHKQGISLAQR